MLKLLIIVNQIKLQGIFKISTNTNTGITQSDLSDEVCVTQSDLGDEVRFVVIVLVVDFIFHSDLNLNFIT